MSDEPEDFAELVAATNYSFLRGASHPHEMVLTAMALGHAGIGIADRNTVSGVVRAWSALKKINAGSEEFKKPPQAREDFKLVVGSRLVFADGTPDIVAYPRNRHGWGRLTRLLTVGNARAQKGSCILKLPDLLAHLDDLLLIVLPHSSFDVEQAVVHRNPALVLPLETQPKLRLVEPGWNAEERHEQALLALLRQLRKTAPDRVWLGLAMPRTGKDERLAERFANVAAAARVPILATTDALYASPEHRPLHDVITCIREGVTVHAAGKRLLANAERHLKEPKEMKRLFRRRRHAVANTMDLLGQIEFDLGQLAYEYPHEPVPAGWEAQAWLEHLVWQTALQKYDYFVPPKVFESLCEELRLIGHLNYANYFLTVYDVVRFARAQQPEILCQGRGSAANSLTCYLLGVTAIDPIKNNLLFSRFISSERDEPPDIDIDFEHERREEVMQHIYQRYGRHRAAITATVIHYRPRSAVREVGKALALSEDITSRLTSTVWGSFADEMEESRFKQAGYDLTENPELEALKDLVNRLLKFPRHLSQHVGGFVLTENRLDETAPLVNGAMERRSFIEWDKDDIDAVGLMKVDVLALGMLTCIRKCLNLMRDAGAGDYRLDTIPEEDAAVYDMLCEGDSIGVFQVESRAQINMLPRLRPRELYDLVIQVAIVRPGPIEGNMVHPYLRRRAGKEKAELPGPSHNPTELEDVLGKTEGVPLFQEQAMRLAIVAAGFSPDEANELRKAMATFRHVGTIGNFEEKMVGGMVRRGYQRDFAERCYNQIKGFGSYGFPESHAQSFAKLVYISSWLKCYHPAAFAAALLNSQPMGFYAPAQIIGDARKHRVEVLPIDVNFSDWDNGLAAREVFEKGLDALTTPYRAGASGHALRLGLRQVDGFKQDWAKTLVEARADGPFANIEDLARRAKLPSRALRLLADADACGSLGKGRRDALWEVRRTPNRQLPLFAAASARELGVEEDARLPMMPLSEEVAADYQTVRMSLKGHPMQFLRPVFTAERVLSSAGLEQGKPGSFARVAGVVLIRQRPGKGNAIFVTLEDETGIVNVLFWARRFEVYRREIMAARLMLVEGEVQRSEEGVMHLIGARAFDRTAELSRLSENHFAKPVLARADIGLQPDPRRESSPRGSHPRDVRILPKSRDFH